MVKKQNYSRKREAILEAICSTDIHPTADWIYQTLKPKFPDLSLGTVYRNITQFKESGQIVSVGVVGGQERLDGNVRPHVHFICSSCGCVQDVDIPPPRLSSEQALCERYGLQVDYEELVLHGKCANCLKGDSPSQ